MNKTELAKSARSGLNWTFSASFLQQAVEFSVSVALARILMPEDFGIVGLAYLLFQISYVVGNLGMGQALIQRPTLTAADRDVGFTTALAVAVLLAGLLFLLSGPSASFFGNPVVAPVTRLLTLQVLFSGIGATPMALLQRRMNFRSIFYLRITQTVLQGGSAIALALQGFGVWSLVWPAVGASGIHAILASITARYLPRIHFDTRIFRSLVRFGGLIMMKNLLVYVGRNADYFVIGKWLGEVALGLYTRAFNLITLPQRHLVGVFGTVFFPAFSRLQDDKAELRRWYIKSAKVLAFIAAPVYLGLATVASDFVIVVYSEKWSGITSALRILAVGGLLGLIKSQSGPILEATDKVLTDLWTHLLRCTLIFFGGLAFVRLGIEAVAVVVTAAHIVDFVMKGVILKKVICLPMRAYVGVVWLPLAGSGLMVFVVLIVQQWSLHPAASLILSVLLGAVTYCGSMLGFGRREYEFLFVEILSRLPLISSRLAQRS